MKYIIESNDVIGYTPKYAMLFGDGYMIQPLEDLEELNSDYINEHFGDLQDTAYQKGFEDGKAVNDKGCEGCKLQGTDSNICDQCCNSYANQWMARDDKIETGDEVNWLGDCFIVTRIFQPRNMKEQCDGIDDDGCVYHDVPMNDLEKTGRHFDIASILEDMRND